MKKYVLLFLIVYLGCKNQPPVSKIRLSLTNHNRQLTISGADQTVLNDIERDSVKNWQSLFAVYRLPADTDLKDYQPIQPGQYRLTDSALVFTPDTPFVKQQAYFLRCYNYAGNKTLWDYLTGKTTKGQLHYTDLIFKQ